MTQTAHTPVALVTGAAGQDGSYLVGRLIAERYDVHAMCDSDAGAAQLAKSDPLASTHIADLADAVVLGVGPVRLLEAWKLQQCDLAELSADAKL